MAEQVIFKPNPGFEEELKHEGPYLVGMAQLANAGAQIARGLAPVRTGRFRATIQPVVGGPDDFGITASHRTWHWYEFGNYHLRPYAPLRGAIEQLGTQFRNAK
jgi:hypothetical protein